VTLHDPSSPGQPEPGERPAIPTVVVYLWWQILRVEPETAPWTFACETIKAGYLPAFRVWEVAEWADRMRERARRQRRAAAAARNGKADAASS
jgi:hypothetical protein